MWPKHHAIYGFLAALGLYLIFQEIGLVEFSLIFLSTVLIDIDHYFYYIFKKNDHSFFRALKWFSQTKEKCPKLSHDQRRKNQEKYKSNLLIFHGLEFVIFLSILTIFFPIFFWILIGVAIHLVMDYHELMSVGMSPMAKISQTYVYITNKHKKETQLFLN